MKNRRPNLVLINFDDLGYGDVSHLNPDAKVRTPHIDSLARAGMVFTDGHSSSSVCTPSRYSLMTGRYNWRTRLQSGVMWGYSPPLIDPGQDTLASLLQRQGYRTGCVGKWHLGLGWAYAPEFEPHDKIETSTPPIDFSAPLTSGPHTLGFDESLIIPASLDMPPYCYIDDGRVVDPPTETIPGSPFPAKYRSGAAAPGFSHRDCLDTLTQRAESFIDRQSQAPADQPFFLYFPAPSPHTPHLPREPFRGQSELGPYGDLIAESDDAVGRLLARLDQQGMADNTVVIVTSDNGAHRSGGEFDYERDYGHRSNHVYRGQKSDAWDGGHRVPLIVRWPAAIAAGQTCDRLTSQLDLFTTAAELSGAICDPEGSPRDSFSLLPLWAGREAEYRRTEAVHHSVTGQFAIRDERWKLILCPGSGGWTSPTDEQARGELPPQQLYDMEDDVQEQHNLTAQHPEVVARLTEKLAELRRA